MGMDQESVIELGWGFYVIILPLVVMLIIQVLIKPNLERLILMVQMIKRKVLEHEKILNSLKKWIK